MKILVIEDNLPDVEMIRELLSEQEDRFEIVHSGRLAEAIELVPEGRFDIVLTDLGLPDSQGLDTIRTLRENVTGIPIVVLTGLENERVGVSALKAGAQDYLVKTGMTGISLIRSLNYAVERYKVASTRYVLLNAIPDALMLLNSDKTIIALNKAMGQKLGINPDEFDGVPVSRLVANRNFCFPMEQIDEIFRTQVPVNTLEHAGGRWYETTMHPVRNNTGTIAMVVLQSHDITDWKKIEEEIEQEGIFQIERNMEQFQILNDQIRNPLQVIKGYVSLAECPFRHKIDEQIRNIDNLVVRLDKGWLDSEKVRTYLFRHYQIGQDFTIEKEEHV